QEYKRCALSADRRAVVLWGAFWDVSAGRQVKPRGDLTDRRPLGFAPDGRTVAMADWHLTGVEFWDATTGEQLAHKPLAGVRHAAFAPRTDADGGVLFAVHNTTDRAGEYHLWRWRGRQVEELPDTLPTAGPVGGVASLSFSPDGSRLAALRNYGP